MATTLTGALSDGSGPENYQPNSRCQWLVAPAAATEVIFNFTEFSTEQDSDIVQIFRCFNISCQGAQLIREMSGSYSSYQIVSLSAGYVLIQFTSDASTTYSGFTASWTSNAPLPALVSALKD
jgi:hypothetical protein